ncbi:hypothetical protein AGMMS50268_36050 [Spirochaetia bacterium]|nr:hypothetical protein AGMMS50268_36050 [Spirochaetia bacterium]
MNVEILNTICINVIADIQKTGIVNLLSQLSTNLQNMINQPQVPQHQQNVSNVKEQLIAQLHDSKFNDFSPFWKENLKEIGFDGLLGNELACRIEDIFNQNQITLSVVNTEIAKISQNMVSLNTTVTQLVDNLKVLNISNEKLENGESEFGVIIPRIAINQNFQQFSDEIIEIKKIVDDFNELVIGTRPEITLKTIASSDYNVLLELIPKVGLAILGAISTIVLTYQSILEIRKLNHELKEQGVPEKNLRGIEEHANEKMAAAVSQGVSDLLAKFASNMEKGRRSEMTISLTKSMNKIANRIDSGYNFDVRFSDEKIDKEMDEEQEEKVKQEIQKLSKNLEFMNLTGEKILSLPETIKENATMPGPKSAQHQSGPLADNIIGMPKNGSAGNEKDPSTK